MIEASLPDSRRFTRFIFPWSKHDPISQESEPINAEGPVG